MQLDCLCDCLQCVPTPELSGWESWIGVPCMYVCTYVSWTAVNE